MTTDLSFDIQCRACPRLTQFLAQTRSQHPDYYCQPVPAFGAASPQLLIVGLAPGMHGANRTGRPFTGDHAGILLYQTLYKFGLANRAVSHAADDDLLLHNCRITNAVKCLPPQNKPSTQERSQCNVFLRNELKQLARNTAVLALGQLAHQAVLKALNLRLGNYIFAHGARHALPQGLHLWDSYHCSRYNTQTKRLSVAMFEAVFSDIVHYLKTLPIYRHELALAL